MATTVGISPLEYASYVHAANTGDTAYPIAYDWSTATTLTVPRYGKHQDQAVSQVKREKNLMFTASTVVMKHGTVGQVFYGSAVVWESRAYKDTTDNDGNVVTAHHQARKAADEAITSALLTLFSSVPTTEYSKEK
jgi:hypothetical protein